ncbi:hypothetical protein M422DRAFT_272159 [Sphaerobolus stellatus SS14]|uniref:Uncharacterized protein n=1 Tax=Sphaerobolus stellatus (strain SS14) TaxID=990650 RepID=A0A0C9UN69_SPHS4|nr:hypothetical protein M422DRAFT_272159 [Sphaerobolus stellatus SS14]
MSAKSNILALPSLLSGLSGLANATNMSAVPAHLSMYMTVQTMQASEASEAKLRNSLKINTQNKGGSASYYLPQGNGGSCNTSAALMMKKPQKSK